MGFRLRFLCPPPCRCVFRVNRQGLGGGMPWEGGGGIPGGGGSITRNAGAYRESIGFDRDLWDL